MPRAVESGQQRASAGSERSICYISRSAAGGLSDRPCERVGVALFEHKAALIKEAEKEREARLRQTAARLDWVRRARRPIGAPYSAPSIPTEAEASCSEQPLTAHDAAASAALSIDSMAERKSGR